MEVLNSFSNIIYNNEFIAIFIAMFSGFISSFSPCTLSTLPLIIGYISGLRDEKKDNGKSEEKYSKKIGTSILYGVFFCVGIIITFTIIGVISSLIGTQLKIFGSFWYMIISFILIIVSLQLFGVFRNVNTCKIPKFKKGFLGAFFLGILGGFFDSPCSTPVLLAILAFIAKSSNITFGIVLMICYSLGHCFVIMLAVTSLDTINRLAASNKYMKIGNTLKVLFGIITFVAAMYLLYIAI
ncbi:MAG: cytochrome c biogenesis protein CcdA [Clostridia bacterium]